MYKTEIKNGKVVNIIVVDPNNIPDWCIDWPEAKENTVIGDGWDGKDFYKIDKS